MLDYLVDLESDFSRFHRVDDIYSMEGPRFFQMAYRMSWFGGVMAHRVEEQQRQHEQQPVATTASPQRQVDRQKAPQQAPRSANRNVVDLNAFMLGNPGMIEKRRVKRRSDG